MLIAVTLNAPDDWDDHRNMFDYGFEQYTSLLLQSTGSYVRTVPVIGMFPTTISVANENDVKIILPKQHADIILTCELPRWIAGNVEKGARIGQLVWRCDGKIIALEPLVAQASAVSSPQKISLWERFLSLFS